MTIEQKPELNRFVDPSIPLTWAYRWRQFKLTLPIWIFIWVCLLETGLLKAWFADRLTWDFILTLLGLCPFIVVFVFGMVEIQVRIQQCSKRIFQIKEKHAVVKPAKQPAIKWKQITKFQFEPIPESAGLTVFKVFTVVSKRHLPIRARWAMVLETPAQVQELVANLQRKKAALSADFEIEILEKPLPVAPAIVFSTVGFSLCVLGYYLLLHGGPLLILGSSCGHSNNHSSNTHMTDEKKAQIGNWIASHFSSTAQFHQFVFWLGLGLTSLGIIFLVWGSYLMRFNRHNATQSTTQN